MSCHVRSSAFSFYFDCYYCCRVALVLALVLILCASVANVVPAVSLIGLCMFGLYLISGYRFEWGLCGRHGATPEDSVEDARDAVIWMQQRAEEFGIDPQRMVRVLYSICMCRWACEWVSVVSGGGDDGN